MNITVFNRYENKFKLNNSQYHEIIKYLDEYMVPDEHSKDGGFYSICNIYYDSPDDSLIRKSIEKPVYKEKLRLRSYGIPDDYSESFIEIKKKFKGNVNKRRITLPLKEAVDYLDRNIPPDSIDCNSQIFREIDYMKNRYALVPKVYISYDRRAYFGKDDRELRITFDTNIRGRRVDLDLQKGAYGDMILEKGYWLMEIKISQSAPLWLAKLLSDCKVYKTSFSKYGTEYTAYINKMQKKGEKVICLNQYSQQQKQQYQPSRQS